MSAIGGYGVTRVEFSPIPVLGAQSHRFITVYLHILSLFGVVLALGSAFIAFIQPEIGVAYWLAFPLLIFPALIQVSLRFNRLQLAGHFFVCSSMVNLVLLGQFSYSMFVLTTAGYLGLFLTSIVLLPVRGFAPYFLIAFVSTLGTEVQYFLRAGDGREQDTIFFISVSQNFVFIISVFLVWAFYKLLHNTFQQMHADRNLLSQHSIELELSNDALAASEARYRTLVENATEAIIVCEIETWRIVDANREAVRLFGYSLQEMKQMTSNDLSAEKQENPDSLRLGAAIQERVLSRRQIEFPWTHKTKDGREFEAEVRLILLPGTSPRLVRASVVDVSERRRRERESREADERLRLLTDNIPIRIAYISPEYKIVSGNREFNRQFGRMPGPDNSLEELLGQEMFETVNPQIDRALAGETVSFEFAAQFADGIEHHSAATYVPHIMDGQAVGVFAMGIDVTEVRQSARELEETSAFLKLITDNMPARLAYVLADGSLFFMNKQYEQYGFPLEDMIGQNYREIVPNSLRDQISQIEGQIFSGNPVSTELRYENELGNERIDRLLVVPNRSSRGIEGFIVLTSDITEQRHAEESLRQRQRLESLGILSGGIAHDFNNLLVAILGQSSLASAKMDEKHPSYRHIERASSAANRAAMLTRQMLAYSSRGSFSTAPLKFNDVIVDNLNLFENSISKTHRLEIDLDDSLPLVYGDDAQIQQIVMNLLLNASQAIEGAGGVIKVKTAQVEFGESVQMHSKYIGSAPTPGNYVLLEVSDNGTGMDDETREHIFDPFYSTKDTGSGLGLAAVLGIIRGHEGVISVDSTPGIGTTFQLYFPIVEHAEVVAVISAENEIDKLTFDKYVLVIDDDAYVTESAADMLDFDGIPVLQANSAHEGIRLFRERGQEIAGIVLDLTMSGMSGEEVFHELKRFDSRVKIIVSSGYSCEEVAQKFDGIAFADFLQKPYNHETLRALVRKLFTRDPASERHEADGRAIAAPIAEG